MKNSQIIAAGITINADQPQYMNLFSHKGHGQVIDCGLLGYQMNYSPFSPDENSDVRYFDKKGDAKKALVDKLK